MPLLIVLLGLGIYAIVVLFLEKRDFIANGRFTKVENIAESSIDSSISTPKSAQNEIIEDIAQAPDVVDIAPPSLDSTSAQDTAPQAPIAQELESIPNISYATAKRRLNIRQSASTQALVLSSLNIGEKVELISEPIDSATERFIKIRNANGIEGFVALRFLNTNVAESAPQTNAQTSNVANMHIVKPNTLNVRLEPDSNAAIIGYLTRGMRVVVHEVVNGFAKVQLPNQQYGYTAYQYLAKE